MKKLILTLMLAGPGAASAQTPGAPFVIKESGEGFGSLQQAVDAIGDSSGTIVHRFERRPGVVRIAVPVGQEGTCWMFDVNSGFRLPLNVPPWLAASPDELLVPARVR